MYMAAKLTSCFSTSLSLRRRYNLDNVENEYELPPDKAWNKESSSDDNLRAKNLKFGSSRNGTQSKKTSAVFDQQIPSNEDLHDDWMFIKKQSSPSSEQIHLLRRRANARNVSFRISLRWLSYIVNSVDKTKLSCNTLTDAAPQFL